MIDHVSVAVSNLEASAGFYDRVLEALDLKRMVERGNTIGFGKNTQSFGSTLDQI